MPNPGVVDSIWRIPWMRDSRAPTPVAIAMPFAPNRNGRSIVFLSSAMLTPQPGITSAIWSSVSASDVRLDRMSCALSPRLSRVGISMGTGSNATSARKKSSSLLSGPRLAIKLLCAAASSPDAHSIDAVNLRERHRYRSKCLVDLEQIDVVDCQPGASEHDVCRVDGTVEHELGVTADDALRQYLCARPHAEGLGSIL